MTKTTTLLTFLSLLSFFGFSQQATLHGYVKDESNGEALIASTIRVKNTTTGTVTNAYGFYSLSLPIGDYIIVYSYIGYNEQEKRVSLKEDQKITVELSPNTQEIDEIVITSKAKNDNIVSTKMGIEKIDAKTIEKLPVLMGEADVIKTLQLMPGVVPTSEMSSNLSVRGGNRDQNLILLDEATVYNASHLLGLFSVFNNDAIKNVEIYKGIIPAQYSGAVSSVIDLRMKEGNTKEFAGVGSIGTLTSKLTMETPIAYNKGAILLSGRRTYIDMITKMASKINDSIPEVPYHFYDLNAKANYTLNDEHRIFLSGYFGRDVAKFEVSENSSQSTNWGNYTGTLRWNYVISNKLFANTTFLVNNYNYYIDQKATLSNDKAFGFKWKAELMDYSLKLDFGYFLNPNNSIKFGAQTTYHDFTIGEVNAFSDTLKFDFKIPKMYCVENSVYVSNEQSIGESIKLEYGFNFSFLNNIGKGKSYKLKNYKVTDTTDYKSGELYNTYFNLDPRVSLNYKVNEKQSIKVGYARTHQYLQVASNSSSGTPLDVWMPVTENVKPQYAHQVSAGYFRNFLDNSIQTSVESYYKYMFNQIEFKEFAQPYLNSLIEEELRFGNARAYGLELMVKKTEGKLTGWISYTLSKSERKIKGIQEKNWYASPYDQRHNLAIVGMYDITNRLSFSANWVFNTGKPFDAPSARYTYGNIILPYYNGKNASRYPNYHRLDLSLEWKNKPNRFFESSWTLSVYNVYDRKNANAIYFQQESQNKTQAYRFAMMQRIPSVSFNLKF